MDLKKVAAQAMDEAAEAEEFADGEEQSVEPISMKEVVAAVGEPSATGLGPYDYTLDEGSDGEERVEEE